MDMTGLKAELERVANRFPLPDGSTGFDSYNTQTKFARHLLDTYFKPCEWRYNARMNAYEIGCEPGRGCLAATIANFCPYCGREIREVE